MIDRLILLKKFTHHLRGIPSLLGLAVRTQYLIALTGFLL